MKKKMEASQPRDDLVAETRTEVGREKQSVQRTVSRNGVPDEKNMNREESAMPVLDHAVDVVKENTGPPIVVLGFQGGFCPSEFVRRAGMPVLSPQKVQSRVRGDGTDTRHLF